MPERKPFHVHTVLIIILYIVLLAFVEFRACKGVNCTVCESVDIRNNVNFFNKLEDCTVIEGHLQILLIDKATTQDYENLTFPKLREITDYLLLYRAKGLQSLAKMFPNLAVIRGKHLFSDFALVVFEMTDLQEVGLNNLTVIERGSVRIAKNPNLCFVDSIDWDQILKSGKGTAYIKDNKLHSECPNCPSKESGRHEDCPHGGTSSLSAVSRQIGKPMPLCWTTDTCQRVCSSECERANRTCYVNSTSTCCHEQCLGGCTGPSHTDCIACRKVSFQGQCVSKCPTNPVTFEYLGRRCVDFSKCTNMGRNRPTRVFYKAFQRAKGNSECSADCPLGYEEHSNDKHKCIKCRGLCKVCQGGIVGNVAQAQNFKGCTYVNGSLEISFKKHSANMIQELEDNLQYIKEIHGYLKIVGSNDLITLHFLRNLKTIHGQEHERENYSLLVFDNQNLQELFQWNLGVIKQKLQIKRGRVFFHMNPKLCYDKITELKTKADIVSGDWDEHDVSRQSNGDRIACQVTDLSLNISSERHSANITFINFQNKLNDHRSLLGYLIYYREAPHNVSMFDGMDACDPDEWNVEDIEVGNDNKKEAHVFGHITLLKPFTRYAIYVKTYTVCVTPIRYFMTKHQTPEPPNDVKIRPLSSREIKIEWKAPRRPNGIVTYYEIVGSKLSDEGNHVYRRDYCNAPVSYEAQKTALANEETSTTNYTHWLSSTSSSTTINGDKASPKSADCCSCKKLDSDVESEASDKTVFEDYLQNFVYVRRPKREIDSGKPNQIIFDRTTLLPTVELTTMSTMAELTTFLTTNDENSTTATVPPATELFRETVLAGDSGSFTLEIGNLSHFARYSVSIRACQVGKPEDNQQLCSPDAMEFGRTLPLGGSDDLRDLKHEVKTENITAAYNKVLISWEEPTSPNGLIVSFQVEYKRLISDKSEPKTMCVTRAQYLNDNKGLVLTDLPSGNYSLRVRASSLAGWGNYTSLTYFEVPDPSNMRIDLTLVIIAAVAFVSLVAFDWFLYKRKEKVPTRMYNISANPVYIPAYEPDQWEVKREMVKCLHELGRGSFGAVYEGIIYDLNGSKSEQKCAIKTLNTTATKNCDFLLEASVMKAFNAPHVVRLLGIVSIGHPVYVLMELMESGDLKTFLRNSREGKKASPPSLNQMYKMAAEIADGMAYLSAKKYVHRDLAGRNCMVAADLTVKIGDFGMTRNIYETDYYRDRNNALLPIKWMAPESLIDGVFTSQSDVWSYGVVMWEMVTLAMQPYGWLSNDQALKFVITGGVMEKPENCAEKTFTIMTLCWAKNPKARPTFVEIIEMLLPDVENTRFVTTSWYNTEWLPKKNALEPEEQHATEDMPLTTGMEDNETLPIGEVSPIKADDHVAPASDSHRKYLPSVLSHIVDSVKIGDKSKKSNINCSSQALEVRQSKWYDT